MRIADLLTFLDQQVAPEKTKVHLATWNGREDPLEVYLSGNFHEWQRLQTRRNLERPFVLSLIALTGRDQWLFGANTQLVTGVTSNFKLSLKSMV